MSFAQELETSEAVWDDVIFPPGDLLSDEPPLETDLHRLQMTLLIACLEWLWRERNDFYASGNLTIYYSPRQRKSEKFRGPDFFVVLGVERFPRQSWVDIFRTPDYFWFDPDSLEFKGFHLVDGEYAELQPNQRGWLWSKQLGLYLGIYESQLRFFSTQAQLIPTPQKVAAQEQQQRVQAEQQLTEMELLLSRYRERFGELQE